LWEIASGPVRQAQRRLPGDWTAFGGYGKEELAGYAYRVYQDPADLLAHLDEVGNPELWIRWRRSKEAQQRLLVASLDWSDPRLFPRTREPISGTMYIPVVLVCDRPPYGQIFLYHAFFLDIWVS
jgi:hypothetical protein